MDSSQKELIIETWENVETGLVIDDNAWQIKIFSNIEEYEEWLDETTVDIGEQLVVNSPDRILQCIGTVCPGSPLEVGDGAKCLEWEVKDGFCDCEYTCLIREENPK